MSDPQKNGKTLWEMFLERLHPHRAGGALVFANPRALNLSSAIDIPAVNDPEVEGYDFTVAEIREYTRRLGGQMFVFTDYVLRGINTQTFDADQTRTLRLRSVPNAAGGYDTLLLRLEDEFGFAEDFLNVLRDETGVFNVTDDASGATDVFTRLNHLREPYEAAVLVISKTTPESLAAAGGTAAAKFEYWDYAREVALSPTRTAQEFLFIELNTDTGWFQLWRGREFFG